MSAAPTAAKLMTERDELEVPRLAQQGERFAAADAALLVVARPRRPAADVLAAEDDRDDHRADAAAATALDSSRSLAPIVSTMTAVKRRAGHAAERSRRRR